MSLKYLYLFVLVTLIILALIFFCLSNLGINNQLFSNLTSEIIGIGIAFLVVERLINYYIKSSWKQPEKKIFSTLQGTLFQMVSNIISGLNFTINEVFNTDELNDGDRESVKKEIVRAVDEELIPINIERKLNDFEDDDWEQLAEKMREVYNELDHFISLFSDKIDPKKFDYILNIRESLRSSIALLDTTNDGRIAISDERKIQEMTGRIFSFFDDTRKLLIHVEDEVY